MKSKKKLDAERIAELKCKQKEIKKQKKVKAKRAAKDEKRAQEELRKREEYILIQSTQLSVPVVDILKGVIITKDQRYLKILEFMPQNFLMFSNEDRNNVSQAFAGVLKTMPVKVQFKVFARKAKVDSLLETIEQAREMEENPLCRRMQEEYIEHVKNTALREGVTRRFLVIVEYSDNVATDGSNFDEIASSLNQTATRIRSLLESTGNLYVPSCDYDSGITSLFYEILNRKASETEPFSNRAQKVFSHYMKTMTEAGIDSPPPVPATEFISPAWMDYTHPRHLVVDDKFYTFGYFSSTSFPNYVFAGWLNGFINASEGVDVDIFIERVPTEKVEGNIGRQIRNNRAKLKEAADTTTDAYNVSDRIQSGLYLLNGLATGEDFYYANVLITVCGDDIQTVNYRFNELQKMARRNGITLRRTIFRMEDAFLSSLPLCKLQRSLYKKSRRNMLTSGASSLYPFISQELQDSNGIMIGVDKSNGSLIATDVFDTSKHPNANVAIIGKSGYGKTFTAQLFAIRMRLQHIQTFIITPLKGKEDYKRACDQIDGQFVSLGPGSPYSINIFDIRVPDIEGLQAIEGYDETASFLTGKIQSILTFLHLVVSDLTEEEEQMLDGYLYKVYAKFGITDDNNSVYVAGTKLLKQVPLMEDLYNEIKDDEDLKKVSNILTPFINGSQSSYNKYTNVNLDNQYIVFDMNGIKGKNLTIAMFVALDFVWSRIKENRLAKKAVFIDEAWQLIGSQSNEMAAEYVKEIFKTIRAFGGSAFVMTQEISDFFSLNDGEYGKAIISNSDTKIVLHLDNPEAALIKNIMSLTKEEYETLKKFQKGEGLLSTGGSKVCVQFVASDFETDVITTDPNYLRSKMQANNQLALDQVERITAEEEADDNWDELVLEEEFISSI